MLQAFFSPEVDQVGAVLEKNSNSIFFEGGKITPKFGKDRLLNKLKIASIDNGFYMEYQGKYPVIFVNFKDIEGRYLDSIKSSVAEVISDVYKTHEYLSIAIDSKPSLSDGDKDNLLKFRNILNRKATEAELRSSLRFLSTLLQKHFDRKVYILVDEYDKAFNSLLEDNWETEHSMI
jgi:hypothetical protein